MSSGEKYYNDQSFHYVLTENLQVGPLVYPNKDGANGQVIGTNGKGKLSFITGTGTGNVTGPSSSVDSSIVLFSGTTGALLKDSLGTINGAGLLTIPALVAGSITYPITDGTNGQVLTTNGAGMLSFTTVSGGGSGDVTGPSSSTNTAICIFNGTTGKIIQNSLCTISSLGTLSVVGFILNGLTFPSSGGTNGQVLTSDGVGSATWQTPSSGSGSMNRLLAIQSSSISLNIGAGDHFQFNLVLGSNGSTIVLDTSSPYSNGTNTASVGRITLTGGNKYILYGTMQGLSLLLSLGSIGFQWYNSDTGIAVTTAAGGTILGIVGLAGTSAPTAVAFVSPSVTTRYELRITSVVSLSATGIVVLDATQVA